MMLNLMTLIAIDPVTDIIYATDNGIFGIVDAKTAVFTPIGEVGSGNGDAGVIELNDVDGLTYDPVNQIMYGTHRVGGFQPNTNDLLFQIDVATGQVIPGAMLDAGNIPVDYAIIPEVFDGTFGDEVYDVDDIAYNPYNGKLYALQNQDDPGTITEIDPLTGEIIEVVFDTPEDGTEGMGFSYLGELYTTSGDNGSTCGGINCPNNWFIYHNLEEGISTQLGYVDLTGVENDYEAFDCFTAYNDLALKIEVEETTEQPVLAGSTVDFIITIYNQGDFNNSDITITNYIPNGLEIVSLAWTDPDNGKAFYTLKETLEPGSSATVRVSYKVVGGFEGKTLTNAAEISYSISPDIIDVQGNQFKDPLPDLDSQPDFNGNETNVKDNEINGGGPNANQDEDDHDIAIIKVGPLPCPAYLIIPDGEINGYFQAQQEIDIRGEVKKTKTAEFDICQ